MEGEKLNIDSIIQRLLDMRRSRPGKNVRLTEAEIRGLCLKSREIFLSQPILLELEAPVQICGDIRGQYYDLLRRFEFCGFPPEANYLFLGNYVDLGRWSLETICLLLAYKIKYPENFFLLRGNHECACINRIFGFYDECKRRYNIRLWKTFTDCFNCLPVAAIIDEKVFCCHGGLSPDLQSMEQIQRITRPTDVPDHGLLCDLLWANPDNQIMGWGENDPIEWHDIIDGSACSFTFGPEIVSKFLAKHDMDLVVRGHQIVEDGYEFFAKRQLVTLFSAPNFRGEFGNSGASMSIDETLMCSFRILKPASDRKMGLIGIRSREIHDHSSSIDSFQETMQKGYTALEPDLFREIMQKGYTAIDLFQEAMQKGYVILETTVLLLIGVAGAGKTSFCHLLFNEPPPEVRSSTPIACTSIRAMSLTKACVQTEEKEIVWERVTARKLNNLIADGIKSVHTHGAHQTLISHTHSEDELRLHSITLAPAKQPVEDTQRVKVPSSAEGTFEQSVIKPIDIESANVDTANTEAAGNSEPIKSDVTVAQLFEMEHVKELLKTVDSVEGSGEIFKRKWLYVIDTGGQPQFHELLPTFVHHVSAAVLFVKLNELLKANPMIGYYKDDTLCGKSYKSSYNHLQILQNCLQAMQSRNQMNSSSQCPKLLFVGTHRDKQSWFSSEGLKSKNAQLLEMLLQHDTFRDNLIYYSMGESDQLLYPVNAKNPRSGDKQVTANFRQKVVSQCQTQEYKVPIRWFVLEQLLQDLSKDGVVSFDKCVEVAGHLGMDKEKLLAALEYLVQLNIFEYYLKVLPKVVFTTSQVLLDKITELIEYSHLLRGADFHLVGSSDPKFREHGMINAEMLKRERFSSHFISGLFEVKDLLDVWVELLVVAEDKDGNFIVPAVLPDMSLEKLSEYRLSIHSSEVIPIAIHYPGSFFPSGTFSSLVSYLQNKSGDWAIAIKSGKPACLYKNCVNFSVSGNITANVTLIYSHEWIEVHAITCGKNKKVCLLLDHIFKGLKRAQEIQKYNDFVPELAFFCPFNHGNPPSSHLASPIAPDDMQCRRDQSKYSDLSEKHKLWLEPTDVYIIGAKHCVHDAELDTTAQEKIIKPEKLSTLRVSESVYTAGAKHRVHDAESDTIVQEQIIKPNKLSTLRVSESDVDITSLSSRPRLYELDRIKGNGKTVTIIRRTAAVWERVATRLHFEEHEIMCIKKDNHFQCEDACRAMFSKWLEGKGHIRTPTNWDTVIKALEEANLGEVAQDLKEVLGV